MKDNIIFRFRLFRKKLQDRKIKNKHYSAMIFIALFTITGVGIYSYQLARKELIKNSRQTVSELIRQGRQKLDERKKVFEGSSYRILQMAKLETILSYTKEEAKAYKVRNEGLPSAIMQQSLLYQYTKFALLRPKSNVIYDYFPGGERRMGEERMNALLDQLEEEVSMHQPVAWVHMDGADYFVRKVVTADLEEKGILVCQTNGELIYLEEAHNILAIIHSRDSEWSMAVLYSKDVLLSGVNHIGTAITVFLLAALVISFFLVHLLSRTITRNVVRIENGMKEFEKGNFRHRISPASYDEVGLLGLQLNYMAEQIENLMEIQNADEEKKRQMEIATLQAQINPHFLDNTLGSFKWSAYRAGQKELTNAISADSKNQEAALKFVSFMTTSTAGEMYVEEGIGLCVIKDVEAPDTESALGDIVTYMNEGKSVLMDADFDANFSDEYRDAFQNTVSDFVLNGASDVDGLLSNLDSEFDRIAGN